MSVQVTIRVQEVQKRVLEILDASPDHGSTFAELFEQCALVEGARLGSVSHDRILDRALQGLRRHGDIRYNRKRGLWERVPGAPGPFATGCTGPTGDAS